MNFGDALTLIKHGKRLTRTGWNGKNLYVKLQEPDLLSKMSLPYIYIKTAQNHFTPWSATNSDILANDWEISEVSNGFEKVSTPIGRTESHAYKWCRVCAKTIYPWDHFLSSEQGEFCSVFCSQSLCGR